MKKIAIIGSGPTGVYTAMHLADGDEPISLTIYESQREAGKGTPYHQDWNDEQMLSNIASIELPPIGQTLLEWVKSQPDWQLDKWGVVREEIHDRTFFPRVTLGEYFKTHLRDMCTGYKTNGNHFELKIQHHVDDVVMERDGIRLKISGPNGEAQTAIFDYVVMATGHVWPKKTEIRPGYFLSPWPASALGSIQNCHVGIRGTSLSGIDAAVTLAIGHGSFRRHHEGHLEYVAEPGSEAFRLTMLSRKGLLPEADFYYPLPYEPLEIFTPQAVEALLTHTPKSSLLSAIFDLFKRQLSLSDPTYAAGIGLESSSLEDFAREYFREREAHETFDWARRNLAEAQENQKQKITVAWRYAILRMHEVIKHVVPHLQSEDYKSFNRYFKPVFVDDYATVPHESIERLIALHEAEKLKVRAVGEDYTLDTHRPEGGARLVAGETDIDFPAFIEAMGQRALSVHEFPFPSLWKQGVILPATADCITHTPLGKRVKQPIDIGGIDLDGEFHPVSDAPHTERLYCLSIPFMLSQFPFAQGITSSHEMGQKVAEDILRQIGQESSSEDSSNQTPDLRAAV